MDWLQYWMYLVGVIIGTSILDSVSGQCSCYSYHGENNIYSWNNAQVQFKNQNGDLVSMETLEEWRFIKDQIQTRQTKTSAKNEWWIGLRLEPSPKKWKWVTNASLVYNKWQPARPSSDVNKVYTLIAREYPTNYKGSFNNDREILQRGYICEYKKRDGIPACTKNTEWCLPVSTTQRTLTTTMSEKPQSTLSPRTTTSIATQDRFIVSGTPVQPSPRSQPVQLYVIIIILAVLLVVVIILVVFFIKFKKRRDLKPRNSHFSKDARVPVELDRNSSCDNLNDRIIYADVINMDGHKIQVNIDTPSTTNTEPKPHVYATVGKKEITDSCVNMQVTGANPNGAVDSYKNAVSTGVEKNKKKGKNKQTNNNEEITQLLNTNKGDEVNSVSVANPVYAEVGKKNKVKKKGTDYEKDNLAGGNLTSGIYSSEEALLDNDGNASSMEDPNKCLYANIEDRTNGKAYANQESEILYAQLADLDNPDLTSPTKIQSSYTETDYATIIKSPK